ncbi:hypothetical protein DNM47_01035 [Salmonella enterica subsp. enterica]|nr:hypothetical protein [Salmonella enterica subsp. enterica serovar Senftenberg]
MNLSTATPNTKKFYQLVDIRDFRYDKNCSDIDYGDIACDCDTKTISILEAIQHISLSIFTMADESNINGDKLRKFSGLISDLTEIALATNKISQTAAYLSGVQDGNHEA